MPRNDEGEFELVLGNRQLLSGFFIVVVLFGVFFNLGYIVGRHSSPTSANTVAATPEAAAAATSAPGSPSPGQAQVMPAEQPKPDVPAVEAAKPETAPAQTAESTKPVTATRPATAPPESPRSEPKPAEPKSTAAKSSQPAPPPETKASSSTIAEPAPGSYLQVAAPSRGAAGAVVESLKNKGIHALIAPGPNEATVRVLVGPLEASSVGKMRSELESAGFKPFSRKY